jgi:hypothetical protein
LPIFENISRNGPISASRVSFRARLSMDRACRRGVGQASLVPEPFAGLEEEFAGSSEASPKRVDACTQRVHASLYLCVFCPTDYRRKSAALNVTLPPSSISKSATASPSISARTKVSLPMALRRSSPATRLAEALHTDEQFHRQLDRSPTRRSRSVSRQAG